MSQTHNPGRLVCHMDLQATYGAVQCPINQRGEKKVLNLFQSLFPNPLLILGLQEK